jgi:sortase A
MNKRLRFFICVITLLSGSALVGIGLFPQAKAALAQVLLEEAWRKTLAGDGDTAPWSWADFRPVAALAFPEHNYRAIVVSGASGTSLAFAPGLLDGTPPPGAPGNAVVLAHRETHFAVLEKVMIGDNIIVTDTRGNETTFRVCATRVIASDDKSILAPRDESRLTLVTCYPSHAALSGEKRFVVTAKKISG